MKYKFMWLLGVLLFTGITSQAETKPPADHLFPGKVRLTLPSVIYGVVGIEMNVYFDNVVLVTNPDNYAFRVICGNGWKGIQQSERWTFIPKSEDIGKIPFQIEVRDQDNVVVARAKSTIKILPADAGAGQKMTMLCIGDSLTCQAVYIQHFMGLCQGKDNPRLTLVGSLQGEGAASAMLNEGAPGQTTEWFATKYSPAARKGTWQERQGSPFLYLGSDNRPKLDFARYCQDINQGKHPNIVVFFLGINDVFSPTDENIESKTDQILKYYDELIAMVQSVNKNTIIGVTLIPPPAASQDAFGANCGCYYTRWQYKRNQHRLVERLIEHFGGREKDQVFLIPAYVNLDCRHNYPTNSMPWNSRNAQQGIRQVNAVHPAPEGYFQIGDSFYCWIKAVLSLSTIPLRFDTMDNTVADAGLVRLRREYRQERDQPMAFEAEEATQIKFEGADRRIMKDAQASGGFYIHHVKRLEFNFTVETAGSYQVRFRSWFPLKAPYNHRECMDDGEVRNVCDSQSNDQEVWFWTSGTTYELSRGQHRYLLPSPTAFCAGARLDKVVFLPVDRNEVKDFGPAATPLATPLTGKAMTAPISLRRIKAWQLNYEIVPNEGTATVEYSVDKEKWIPVSPGEFIEVPLPKPQFLYLRFVLVGKEGQPSPWIQGIELQGKEEANP